MSESESIKRKFDETSLNQEEAHTDEPVKRLKVSESGAASASVIPVEEVTPIVDEPINTTDTTTSQSAASSTSASTEKATPITRVESKRSSPSTFTDTLVGKVERAGVGAASCLHFIATADDVVPVDIETVSALAHTAEYDKSTEDPPIEDYPYTDKLWEFKIAKKDTSQIPMDAYHVSPSIIAPRAIQAIDRIQSAMDTAYPSIMVKTPAPDPAPLHDSPFHEASAITHHMSPFQLHAAAALRARHNVLVTAHTGAGKTLLAHVLIGLCQAAGEKVVYTTPIKALSNDKYNELKKYYRSVGLVTGDVSENPDADVVVVTTEVLRNQAMRNGGEIPYGAVIFDEVHYMKDRERGVVWEETIITIGNRAQMLFLSATLRNDRDFAQWVATCTRRPCHIVATLFRPVPLVHLVAPIGGNGIHLVGDSNKRYDANAFDMARATVKNTSQRKSRDAKRRELSNTIARTIVSCVEQQWLPMIVFSFNRRECEAYALDCVRLVLDDKQDKHDAESDNISIEVEPAAEADVDARTSGLSLPTPRVTAALAHAGVTAGDGGKDGRSGGMGRGRGGDGGMGARKDTRTQPKSGLTRGQLDLTTPEEKAYIRAFVDMHFPRDIDCEHIKQMLVRGVGVHHSGLLPRVRECTEILLRDNKIKLLFATETFAMGVNVPVRCVAFTSGTKFDGGCTRALTSAEYTQMAGRAGRRGFDKLGICVYMDDGGVSNAEYKEMVCGPGEEIEGRLTLSYNLLLNLMYSGGKVENIVDKSLGMFLYKKYAESGKIDLGISNITNIPENAVLTDSQAQLVRARIALSRVLPDISVRYKPLALLPYLCPGRVLYLGAPVTGKGAYYTHDSALDMGWSVVLDVVRTHTKKYNIIVLTTTHHDAQERQQTQFGQLLHDAAPNNTQNKPKSDYAAEYELSLHSKHHPLAVAMVDLEEVPPLPPRPADIPTVSAAVSATASKNTMKAPPPPPTAVTAVGPDGKRVIVTSKHAPTSSVAAAITGTGSCARLSVLAVSHTMVKAVSSVRVSLPPNVQTDAEKIAVWSAVNAAHKAHKEGKINNAAGKTIFGKTLSGFPGDFPLISVPVHERELENAGLTYNAQENPEDAAKLKAMVEAAVDVHNAVVAVRQEIENPEKMVVFQDPEAVLARERMERRKALEQQRTDSAGGAGAAGGAGVGDGAGDEVTAANTTSDTTSNSTSTSSTSTSTSTATPAHPRPLPLACLSALMDREEDRISLVAALASHTFKLAQNNQNTYVFDGAEGAEAGADGRDDSAMVDVAGSLKPVVPTTMTSAAKPSTAPASMTANATGYTINTKDGDVRARFLMVRDELVSVLRKTGLLDEDLKPTLTGRVAMYLDAVDCVVLSTLLTDANVVGSLTPAQFAAMLSAFFPREKLPQDAEPPRPTVVAPQQCISRTLDKLQLAAGYTPVHQFQHGLMEAVAMWVDGTATMDEVCKSSGAFAGTIARVLSRTGELLVRVEEAAENALGAGALAELAKQTREKLRRGSAFLPSLYM